MNYTRCLEQPHAIQHSTSLILAQWIPLMTYIPALRRCLQASQQNTPKQGVRSRRQNNGLVIDNRISDTFLRSVEGHAFSQRSYLACYISMHRSRDPKVFARNVGALLYCLYNFTLETRFGKKYILRCSQTDLLANVD